MKTTAALTLCLAWLVLLRHGRNQWPPRPWRRVATEWASEGGHGGHDFEDVSRFLAANESNTDDLMADVLVILDFTVSAWQRQQQAEFAAALVGNAADAATNSSWRLNFGFVLLKGNVSYELPLTDDYWMLQQQLLDPNFTSVPDLPQLARNTAEALRLCDEEIDRRALFPPVSTALLVLTAGVSENVWDAPGTIERVSELKVAQKAVIYALALDHPASRTPSRTLELDRMATDSSKEFNVILPPAPTTTGTVTTSTRTSATSTATSSTKTTSTATSSTRTTMTSTSSTATTSTATTSTKTSSTQTTSTATTTSSTSSSATKTTSTSSTITGTTTSSTSSSATKTTSTSSTITATTTSSTSSSATRTTSTSSTATVTTSTSSTITATSTSSTSSSATVTTSTATSSTATTSTATSATTTSTETTSTTTNETENVTFTTTTAATTYQASNESNETATITSTTVTTTFLTVTTTDDDRRLFGDSNTIDIRELGLMIEDDSRRLFGSNNPVDIRDLGSLLGVELLQFFTQLFVSLETTSSTPSAQIHNAGGLAAGIVVVIVLSTCCLIAVVMGIAFFAWHSMRSSAAVTDEVHPRPLAPVAPVAPVLPPRPAPVPAPVPRDATQRALKEAIDMQDITRLRNLLSEILLKGWPEKKYTELVLKALEVVATLKETAAEVLEQALSEGSLPGSALADARFAGVERELLLRAEGLRQRSAGGTARTLG